MQPKTLSDWKLEAAAHVAGQTAGVALRLGFWYLLARFVLFPLTVAVLVLSFAFGQFFHGFYTSDPRFAWLLIFKVLGGVLLLGVILLIDKYHYDTHRRPYAIVDRFLRSKFTPEDCGMFWEFAESQFDGPYRRWSSLAQKNLLTMARLIRKNPKEAERRIRAAIFCYTEDKRTNFRFGSDNPEFYYGSLALIDPDWEGKYQEALRG